MKKFMNRQAGGFTLIELLVVIAIIAILSTIVLASLGNARTRANIAKIKGQLAQMPAAAELYWDTQTPGSYGTATAACTGGLFVDTTSGMSRLTTVGNYPSGATLACNSVSTAWAAQVTYSGRTYCVDSTTNSVVDAATAYTITDQNC